MSYGMIRDTISEVRNTINKISMLVTKIYMLFHYSHIITNNYFIVPTIKSR